MVTPFSIDEPPPPPLRGTVLYIEDDPVNFEVVAAVLSVHPDVQLIHAMNGHDGVRLARSEHPNAVLLDMHLPDISGVEVVRLLSEDIADRRFRIILLTADNLNIDVLKAMSLGAFAYLMKPVDIRPLEVTLRRALSP